MLNYLKSKALKITLKIIGKEIQDQIAKIEDSPDNLDLDLFNTGLKINLKAAKKKTLSAIDRILDKEVRKKNTN